VVAVLTALGLLAGLLTTACWLPQLHRSWRTRSTRDLSWLYLIALSVGIGLWFVYGVLKAEVAIAVTNAATGAALLTLIAFKARFDHDVGAQLARNRRREHTVEAVLIDMDGTLVQSDAAVQRAWLRWADEYGVDPLALEPYTHGNTAQDTVRAVAPHLSEAAIQLAGDRQLQLQYDDLSDVIAAVGSRELIHYLGRAGIPWAVVTSADRRLASARLAAAGIDPPLVVTVDDVASGKPHPEPYLLAAKLLGVDPRNCLVVEDSPPGVTAGQAAGARVAGLRGTPADVAVDDLADVADLLAHSA
jgi:sugar-phosphatase